MIQEIIDSTIDNIASITHAVGVLCTKIRIHHAYEHEQQLRKAMTPDDQESIQKVREIDAKNTAMMKDIIAKYGFPTISQFGKETSHQAWCIAQHADRDKDFQKEVLGLMHPLVKQGEVSKADYAYLYDRVAVGMDKPQYYGTQGYVETDGKWYPDPLVGLGDNKQITESRKDLAVLNARRKQMDIEPFEEYYARINELVQPTSSKAPARG